jgi:hypothetical protein
VPRQFVVFSESAISDNAPRPVKNSGEPDAGSPGKADTRIPFAGPTGDEIRNVALPATTIRVVTVSAPDTVTVRATESG